MVLQAKMFIYGMSINLKILTCQLKIILPDLVIRLDTLCIINFLETSNQAIKLMIIIILNNCLFVNAQSYILHCHTSLRQWRH